MDLVLDDEAREVAVPSDLALGDGLGRTGFGPDCFTWRRTRDESVLGGPAGRLTPRIGSESAPNLAESASGDDRIDG